VLERDERLRSEGAGLTLWPNAVAALRELALGEVVDECGRVLTEAAIVDRRGAVLSPVPIERIAARYGPTVTVHRGELLAALAGRVGDGIEFGAEVGYPDGLEADLVVGADGINSSIRSAIAPGRGPRPAGHGTWRGVAQTGDITPPGATEAVGGGKRFGLVPMAGSRTYWFAVLAERDRDVPLEHAFAGWHPPIQAVLAATPPEERIYVQLQDLAPLPSWHKGHLVLVGDAAHAMTPNLGQGAAQALEDVAVLIRELRRRKLPEALAAYERARKRRAERIVARSRLMGRFLQASHPAVAGARDLALRLSPQALSYAQLAQALGRPPSPELT
jgi:2-polyprenyl-6-methoxyphenol hydroxylase-like FAD-dependent oxidoreductase